MTNAKAAPEPIVYRLPSFVRTRMTGARGGSAWELDRVTWLTPYAADEIGQETHRAGAGARLEVIVPASTTDDGLAAVESLFGWLREKGVTLLIRRDDADV